ncbi:MAG: phosphatidylserine decarboxylase family protein [Planctomycetota bacterium]
MTIARWGIVPICIALLLLSGGALLLPPGQVRWVYFVLAGMALLFVIAFFRNPRRRPPPGEHLLVAPADGIVADIEEVESPGYIEGQTLRIGIFMNVFNVHVNRAPGSGTIEWVRYTPGRFLDVRHPDASHANEANMLGLRLDSGVRVVVRQISGLIARRIVCTHSVGDSLRRGEIFGMIKFGSRLELWLPVETGRVVVRVGQKVRAGETVLVELPEQEGAQRG